MLALKEFISTDCEAALVCNEPKSPSKLLTLTVNEAICAFAADTLALIELN